MRFQFDRSFYLPKDAVAQDALTEGTDAVVYFAQHTTHAGAQPDPKARTRFEAIGFHGKAQKPDFKYTFRSEEERDRYVRSYLDGRKRRAAFYAERKVEQAKPHSLKVGDILNTSWGYDQTNIEFFEVTGVVGKSTVILRELQQETKDTGWLCGTCTPKPGCYREGEKGAPIRRRARANNSVRIDDVRNAWVWSGTEKYWSAYA